jgi:uncharacterized membrane protein
MTTADYVSLLLFLGLWTFFSIATSGRRLIKRKSLSQAVADHRRRWILHSLKRDLKMIDTQIMAGLQNGTAFFASTSIFAMGGCFALLGATDQADAIFRDLPYFFHGGRAVFELKAGGLAVIFGYAFFKFGWAYRLFNYCTILFGGLPMSKEAEADPEAAALAADKVARINILAGQHFNAGLRAIFLSIGYLGWFIHPYVFIATTLFVMGILTRRQYFSHARAILIEDIPPSKGHARPLDKPRSGEEQNPLI